MADGNDLVKTIPVGYRDAYYKGEPLSDREVHRLDEPNFMKQYSKIMGQSLYGKVDKPFNERDG